MRKARLFGSVLALAMLASLGPGVRAQGATNIVFEWNQILNDTLPAGAGVGTPRFYAMTHIAMFDAINSIQREYDPYRIQVPGAGGAPEAAGAQAAHDVMVVLNPAAAASYDAALAKQLGPNPSSFVMRGAQVGALVAKEILSWRQNDGWVVSAFPPYSEPLLPGRWQPTPPNNPVATFTHLQNAMPMALLTSTQYLPAPPPSLTSARYAADLNEIKLIGKSDSATRTSEQTAIARLWAGVTTAGTANGATNFMIIWNNITRDTARQRYMSLGTIARLFVLVNVSIHDSLHTTQTSKFVYGLWRPVTAIRGAADDLNGATDPDPSWLPLLTTPPYPSYAGNMATIGAGAARALELAVGTNDLPVSATWRQSGGLPDVTHQFSSFWAAAEEQSNSRMYGGIHYRFDQEAGQKIGRQVAQYVFANFMTTAN